MGDMLAQPPSETQVVTVISRTICLFDPLKHAVNHSKNLIIIPPVFIAANQRCNHVTKHSFTLLIIKDLFILQNPS
ncbi:MAG: hypothetical protein M0R33_08620 [Methylomonas sp.]|jgi:hypothetical protein|uniref:hypothetical protein n=1 Tax=Methylomonas sp. TaxID=418 RepID=UPI0025F772DC|nr:hypothetical protein [Methylomonas sp.]MCK9606501.1 hypothetical protein [Methylomonas sp.]